MNFSNPELTNFGIGLLIRALAGDTIVFTKIKYGNGNKPANIAARKEIANPMLEVPIDAITVADKYAELTFSYDNGNLSEGFWMRELGVYAKDPDTGADCLYAYGYAGDKAGFLEPYSSTSFVQTTMRLAVVVGNAQSVQATLGEYSGYASNEEFRNHVQNYSNPHRVNKEHVGLGNVENKKFSDQTVAFTMASANTELKTGETMGTVMGKLARAVYSLIAHLKATNPHNITPDAIKAAPASHKHSAADITSGTLGVARGGTGVTSLQDLATKLKPYLKKSVTASYTGNSVSSRYIELGFTPSKVTVTCPKNADGYHNGTATSAANATAPGASSTYVSNFDPSYYHYINVAIRGTGFYVSYCATSSHSKTNENGVVYNYTAEE